MRYLLVIWWILGLLPHFPAWTHRWARILPGPSVAASGCQGSGRDSSTAVLCQTPNEAPQNLYSFPRFRRCLLFQTWDFNWCLRSVFPPFRANQSKNRGYLNVHVWIHAAGGECVSVLTRVTRGFSGFRRRPRFPLDFRHSFEETVPSIALSRILSSKTYYDHIIIYGSYFFWHT